MALIKVGIHENLQLTDKTKINDKGTLELSIASAQSADDMLAAFEGNSTNTSMESSFRFYPPNMKTFEGDLKTAGEIGNEILKMRHQFLQYAKLFATKEEAEAAIGGLAMFKGLGIPPEEIKKALAMFDKEDFVQKVVTNLSKVFLDFLQSKNAFSGEVKFRHKFLRQSKAKNFATIPNSDFDIWVEPMTVPKEASKIAFSEYEIANGKDNGDPVASDDSDTTTEDANKADSLFTNPGSGEAVSETPAQEQSAADGLFAKKPDLQ